MSDQTEKRGRGRPPKHGEAMTGAERQALYAKARARDMARVAYALKDVLARTKANQKAFSDSYRGTTSGERLRRGLARLLASDQDALAFFEGVLPSDDGK
jgi:ATPase subunit of ABC transporter with duplicated ATPase domains